jgi:hypothetical protein
MGYHRGNQRPGRGRGYPKNTPKTKNASILSKIREKEKGPRQEGVPFKRYGYPFRAGGLSCNISGLTFRFIYLGIDLEKDLCSLFHLSLSVVCRLIMFTGV